MLARNHDTIAKRTQTGCFLHIFSENKSKKSVQVVSCSVLGHNLEQGRLLVLSFSSSGMRHRLTLFLSHEENKMVTCTSAVEGQNDFLLHNHFPFLGWVPFALQFWHNLTIKRHKQHKRKPPKSPKEAFVHCLSLEQEASDAMKSQLHTPFWTTYLACLFQTSKQKRQKDQFLYVQMTFSNWKQTTPWRQG